MKKPTITSVTLKPSLVFNTSKGETLPILTSENEQPLIDSLNNIEAIIASDSTNMSEDEKDAAYKSTQEHWNTFAQNLSDTKFSLYLNRPMFNLLTDLMLTKLEYDVHMLFYAIDLTNFLKGVREKADYRNDEDFIGFDLTSVDATYLYHLLAKHKVKGLQKTSYIFADIITKIYEITKIYNYYENESKVMSEKILNWAGGLTPEAPKGDLVDVQNQAEAEEVKA